MHDEVTYLMNNNKVTQTMIVSFDFSTFEATCLIQSEKFNESLSDFDAVASKLFKAGEKLCNRDILQSVFHALSKIQGWEVSINQKQINLAQRICVEPKKSHGSYKVVICQVDANEVCY